MRATYHLFDEDWEYNFGEGGERLIMIFLACAGLPELIRTYAVELVHLHFLSLTMFNFIINIEILL